MNQKSHKPQIETPDLTIAKYVYEDDHCNPVYYDGYSYWVVMLTGEIEWLDMAH